MGFRKWRPAHRKNPDVYREQCDGTSYRLRAVGPYVICAISGVLVEADRAILQRGLWVHPDPKMNAFDNPIGEENG